MAADQMREIDKKVYGFIKESIKEKGFPPTVRDICKAVRIKSTSTVHSILSKLDRLKYIEKDPSLTRAIRLMETEKDTVNNIVEFDRMKAVEVPVLGQVTAGAPLLAVENIEEYFPVPESFTRDRDVFLLRVRGDSMINAGILNNDYVLISKQSHAQNRDIVLALIENEATVKTYYKEKDHIRLQPENEFYEPIICRNNADILGKVVGVFRKL